MAKGITYKDAGVDKEAGYKSVELMKKFVKKTFTDGVVSDLGGFGGLFSIANEKMEEPILVSGTDGVGTKLMVAFMMDKHDTIGEDCVAMCVNDVLCQGAKPLFFLDYVSTGKVEPEKIADIVKGISNGCIKGRSALIGGETAEMPGLYEENHYDLAGFSVGIVDKKNVITGQNIKEGDVIIGLPSSGLHSNGYSLVRKVLFDVKDYDVNQYVEELGETVGEAIIEPTRIYAEPLCDLFGKVTINGICHITGGGFYENIPRIIPEGLCADIDVTKIKRKPIFDFLAKEAGIETKEMYSTFNMGVGIIMVVPQNEAEKVYSILEEKNETFFKLGKITKGEEQVTLNI
jgi:phosphoribosylformylglycinamidine cyclo-ligase